MKRKRFFCTMLVYVFILTLLPVSFIMSKVKAAEDTVKDYTKYNVLKYVILRSALYEDCGVAYTPEGYYVIKKDSSEPEFKAYPRNNFYEMGRVGENLYFYGQDTFASVNLKTGQATQDVKIPVNNDGFITEGVVDSNGGKWFSLYKYDSSTDKYNYSILRLDSENKSSKIDFSNFSTIPEKLQVDSNNNLWISGWSRFYEIGRVSINNNQLSSTVYNLQGITKRIDSFKVDKNGTIWANDFDGDIVELIESNGKLQVKNKYSDTIAMSIALDNKMTPWILSVGDESNDYCGKISKLENGKFIHKYNVNNELLDPWDSDVKVIDDNNMLISSWDKYTLIANNPPADNNNNGNGPNGGANNPGGNNGNTGTNTNTGNSGDTGSNTNTGAGTNTNNNPTVVDNDTTKVIDTLKNAADGTKVTVKAQDNTLADKSVFESIKGKNKTLVYEQDNILWTFNGLDLDGNMKNLDLKVKLASLKDSDSKDKADIQKAIENYDAFVVSFAENGKLPLKAGSVVNVKVKVDSKWLEGKDKNNLYVYYYNPETKKIELVAKQLKLDANGCIEFGITHNSDYFLADKDLLATGTTVLPKTGSMVDMNMLLLVGTAVLVMGAFFTFGRKYEN